MTPPCPFTTGQTIRNTATGETGRVHTTDPAGLPPGWVAVQCDRYIQAWPLMLTELATEAA